MYSEAITNNNNNRETTVIKLHIVPQLKQIIFEQIQIFVYSCLKILLIKIQNYNKKKGSNKHFYDNCSIQPPIVKVVNLLSRLITTLLST